MGWACCADMVSGREGWRLRPAGAAAGLRCNATSFDRLRLGDDDPGRDVKAVMMFSYEALKVMRRTGSGGWARSRSMPTSRPRPAAAAWGCDTEEAFETLTGFANAALLERKGGGVWQQHALLRAFSLALLR